MRRRRRTSGQAMVELAILLPLMMVLFLGSWTAADLIGTNDTALQATRAGARYAAELGNGGYPNEALATCQSSGTFSPKAANPCAADEAIIAQMLPIITGTMPNTVVTEIDIYEPSGANCGAFASGSCPPNSGAYTALADEPINVYMINGTTITPPPSYSSDCTTTPLDCYTLGLRDQVHPNESELGVRIVFKYTSPSLTMFTQQDTQYTVIRLAPVE